MIKTETEYTVSMPSMLVEAYDTRTVISIGHDEIHKFIAPGSAEKAIEIAKEWIIEEIFAYRKPVRYPKSQERLDWARADEEEEGRKRA